MTEYVISVSKSWQNTAKNHRNNTKKHWKIFLFDTDENQFRTIWTSWYQAWKAKRQLGKVLNRHCPRCGKEGVWLNETDDYTLRIACNHCNYEWEIEI